MEGVLKSLIDRRNQLDIAIRQYVEVGNLGDAAINQIKRDTLALVITRMDEELNA